ncbi:MAG: flagellar hook-length control protein FliK, partial [Sulfuricella sp.]
TSLRNTLSQSGLFYESHQAQWVAGERRLTDLLQEPQGKLSALNPGVGAEISQKNAPVSMQSDGLVAQSASRMPVHAEAVALVQQQLQTLDSRQLVWQGQVWQGQPMEWRVEERSAREGGQGDEEMPHWQTSLRLQLPRLGDVQATLAFIPQGLRIDLKAADAATAEAMRGAQDKLRSSMEASGLHVLAMSVERHEKA